MNSYNKQNLLEFLDYAGSKGLLSKNTVVAYRSACKAIFPTVDDENDDFSKIDMGNLSTRFTNLSNLKYKPETLQEYLRRFDKLNSEYRAFKENPASWKPAHPRRSASPKKGSPKGTDTTSAPTVPNLSGESDPSVTNPVPTDAQLITHRFPLRRNVIVSVTGLPYDVKKREMGRFTAFLSNLVAEEDEQVAEQPMLPDPEQSVVLQRVV